MTFLLNLMRAEAEKVAESSADLLDDVIHQSRKFREKLTANDKILPVAGSSMDVVYATSLCAIDGASASQQMQSGDMFSVGSTFSNGQNSDVPELEDGAGSYGAMGFRVHSSDTTSIVGSMRAATEIAVLGDTPHDIAIIDGAMINNYMSVILALQQNQNTAMPLIEFLRDPKNAKAFHAGTEKIFRAHDRKSKGQKVIALAKSDSSSAMMRSYLGRNATVDLKDKLVASTVLHPGELMVPMALTAVPLKPDQLESNQAYLLEEWNPPAFASKWNINKLSLEDKDVLFRILNTGHSIEEVRANADLSVFNQYTYLLSEKRLFFTYYKPTNFAAGEQALRVEFTVPSSSDPVSEIQSILPHLEADIVKGPVKEPYSQFMVDRYAKDAVSSSMFSLESAMKNVMEEKGHDALNALSSYRT